MFLFCPICHCATFQIKHKRFVHTTNLLLYLNPLFPSLNGLVEVLHADDGGGADGAWPRARLLQREAGPVVQRKHRPTAALLARPETGRGASRD